MPILSMENYHNNVKKDLSINCMLLKNDNIQPTLFIITDGKDKKCESYMKSKCKIGEELGIHIIIKKVTDKNEMLKVLKESKTNKIPTICQLPIDKDLEYIYLKNNKYDVDGLTMRMYEETVDVNYYPATSQGIVYHLSSLYKPNEIRNKYITIIGRGRLVGLPLSQMLISKFGCTVAVINSKTNEEVRKLALKQSDIIVLATGVKGSVKMSELSETKQQLIYNVGTCFDGNGKLTTELDINENKDNILYTDRIKAVGISTVLGLMKNVIKFYRNMY